jgi:hypothetical protein
MSGVLHEITAGLKISNYRDWLIFDQRLKELVRSGRVKRVPTLRKIHFKDDEWYLDPSTGEIYLYVRPDPPILPIWEAVDVFEAPMAPEPHPNNLSVIPIGKTSLFETKGIRALMDLLVRQGTVEKLVPFNAPAGSVENWYKEVQTGTVYRLVESADGSDNRWERVPQSELNRIVQ